MLLQTSLQPQLEQLERYQLTIAKLTEFLASPAGGAIVGGGLAAIVTGLTVHAWQAREARIFPVLFSGSDQIGNRDQNVATRFYSSLNDMVMTVTQAWNTAHEQRRYAVFSEQLRNSEILSFARGVESGGSRLLGHLDDHQRLASQADETTAALKASWEYDSHDNYTTITVPSGKTTTTHSIYTSTDHYFTFSREQALIAGEKLTALLRSFPFKELYDPGFGQLSISPDVKHRDSVRDTIFEDASKQVTDEEARQYVNQWVERAYVAVIAPKVSGLLAKLEAIAPKALETIQASEDKYHYNTSSKSHQGPEGYQNSKLLWESCETIHDGIVRSVGSINGAIENAQSLQKMVEKMYIPGPKRNKRLAHEALDFAVESYLSSFPDSGIDMDQRVRHGTSVGIALLVGAGAGAVVYFLHPNTNFF